MIYWIFLNKTNHRGKRRESAKQTTSPNFWPLCSRSDHCFFSSSQSSKWLPLVFGQWLPGLQQIAHNLTNFAGDSPPLYAFRFQIRSDLQISCSSFVTTSVYSFSSWSLPEVSRLLSGRCHFPFSRAKICYWRNLLLFPPELCLLW